MIYDFFGCSIAPPASTDTGGMWSGLAAGQIGQALLVYPFSLPDDAQFDRVTIELRTGGGAPANYTEIGLFDSSKTLLSVTQFSHSITTPGLISVSVTPTTISAGNLWLSFLENEGSIAASRSYRFMNVVAIAASQLWQVINTVDVQEGVVGVAGDYTTTPGSFTTVTSVSTAVAPVVPSINVPVARFWLSTAF